MIRLSRSLMTTGILAAIVFLAPAFTSHAQVPWNTCASTQICNNSNCVATFSVLTTPACVIAPVTLLPGQCVTIPTGGVSTIDYLISAAPQLYRIQAPPPGGGCSCPASAYHVCCVTLPPANCCFDVCFDPTTTPCRITINTAGPCATMCAP